jgi:NADH-quinone oxidoreductase subunit E
MPFIRVLEVASFYTMFALEPVGRHFIQLCGTVPCHVKGALGAEGGAAPPHRRAAARHAGRRILLARGRVPRGAAATPPMVQINTAYYEDLTPETSSG